MVGNRPRGEEFEYVSEAVETEAVRVRDPVVARAVEHVEAAVPDRTPAPTLYNNKDYTPAEVSSEPVERPDLNVIEGTTNDIDKKSADPTVDVIDGTEIFPSESPKADGMGYEATPPPSMSDIREIRNDVQEIFEEQNQADQPNHFIESGINRIPA